MKKITRRQVQAWLAPMRACFAQMRQGEVDAIRGYAVTRLHHKDDYARIDYCIAGFRCLIDRLCPEINTAPLLIIEKKLANGLPLTIKEIDLALTQLKHCENAMLRHPVQSVKDAVMTEQISIELEQHGLIAA